MLIPTNANSGQEKPERGGHATTPLQAIGSFVIAAICRDGIIIGSDSRTNFYSHDGRKLAHFDESQKIVLVDNNLIAYTGHAFIKNVWFCHIIKEFGRLNPGLSIENFLPAFISFCKRSFPSECIEEIRKNMLIAAGYSGKLPKVCYLNERQTEGFSYTCNCRFVQSDRSLFNNYSDRLMRMSFEEVAGLIDRAIKDYASLEGHSDIGGETVIRIITSDQSRWLSQAPHDHGWTYIHDFVKDYRNGKVPVVLDPGATAEEFERLLTQAEHWSRGRKR